MANNSGCGGGGCGCGGCITLFIFLIIASLALYVLGLAVCVAVGVGLWFLGRYVWRSLVRESPGNPLVELGMSWAPITRKVFAAVVCILVTFFLIAAMGGASS